MARPKKPIEKNPGIYTLTRLIKLRDTKLKEFLGDIEYFEEKLKSLNEKKANIELDIKNFQITINKEREKTK